MDAGYDVARLAYALADLPVELVGTPALGPRHAPRPRPRPLRPEGGRPRRHGGVLTFAKPDTWHGPTHHATDTTRYGTAEATGMGPDAPPAHPPPAPGSTTDDELPILHGTLIRLKVEHLPGDRDPKPVWLWSSRHRCRPRGRRPLVAGVPPQIRPGTHLPAAEADARLDRPEDPRPDQRRPVDLADHRRPHPAPPRPPARRGPPPPLGTARHRRTSLTPARVRRGFRNIRAKTARPAAAPKPSRPGPGRPPGSSNRTRAPRHTPGKTNKRAESLEEHYGRQR